MKWDKNMLNSRKTSFAIAFVVAFSVLLAGCNAKVETTTSSDGTAVSVIGGADGPTSIFIAGKLGEGKEDKMSFLINGEEIPVIWEENDTVTELFAQAKTGAVEIQMSMYGGNEQVGPLGLSYTRGDKQMTTKNGDIVLYNGNQLVIFYAPNTWNYTKLGKIDLPEDEVTGLLSNGDVKITIKGK